MKNYLIYVRTPAGKQTPEELSIPDQIEMMEEYAKYRRWNIVGHVADKDKPFDCADKARLKNLRRYLEKHNDIDVVVTAEIQPLSSADCAAIKTLLKQKEIRLTRITIDREEDESTDDLPANHGKAPSTTAQIQDHSAITNPVPPFEPEERLANGSAINCLLYSRLTTVEQAPQDHVPAQIAAMKEYARLNGWNVVGHVADKDESVDCADKAEIKNLRSYLEQHNNVDVVAVTVTQPLSFADYAAMKTILDQYGMRLVVFPRLGIGQ